MKKDVEKIEWLGGTIKVVKSAYTFDLGNLVWYNYVVKRHNGEVIEDSMYRGVNKEFVDERVAYYRGLDKERVEQIIIAVQRTPAGEHHLFR